MIWITWSTDSGWRSPIPNFIVAFFLRSHGFRTELKPILDLLQWFLHLCKGPPASYSLISFYSHCHSPLRAVQVSQGFHVCDTIYVLWTAHCCMRCSFNPHNLLLHISVCFMLLAFTKYTFLSLRLFRNHVKLILPVGGQELIADLQKLENISISLCDTRTVVSRLTKIVRRFGALLCSWSFSPDVVLNQSKIRMFILIVTNDIAIFGSVH